MNKAYETAQHLAESLNFVKDFCRKSECDERDCIFACNDQCCLKGDPEKWDINTIMLNIGMRIGKGEGT